jgi:GNAT superfamily N-acetyltransferase
MDGARFRQYKRLNPRLFEILYERFTWPDGSMRHALNDNRVMKSYVAYKGKEITGWSCVVRGFGNVDDVVYGVNVWVKDSCRHQGLGRDLRRKAALWALSKQLTTFWFDAKYTETWQLVDKDNL